MTKARNLIVGDNVITSASAMTLRQSLVPNISVTFLFFLWGFAYGLLDVLNNDFVGLLNITNAQSSGLSVAYFGAYFICPLTVSGWILRKWGFRITFVTGLLVLCVGSLLFWPSGVYKSFGGFCGSMFIVGAGLSTLETAADPFLSICGPPRYSEIRLNLAQAIQGVGSMAAPLLASYVFFKNVSADNTDGLKQVQWTYLGIACFVALLAIVFFFIPMPEVTDADMALMEAEIGEEARKPFRKQTNLFFGVISQFCYVGAQVSLANYFIAFCIDAGKTKLFGSQLLSAAQGIYAGMRFIFGFLMMSPAFKPRILLLALLGGAFVFTIAAMNTQGDKSIGLLMVVFGFESACFATIFTLSLRGLGRHTKLGGAVLVSATSGGMLFPPLTGVVIDARNAHFAMIVPAMAYVGAWTFPIYVNFFNYQTMDLHRATALNVDATTEKEVELERAQTADEDAKGGQISNIEDVRQVSLGH